MLVPYQEIQALGFPNSPRKLGLYEKPWACISWYGPCTQLVNSKYRSKWQNAFGNTINWEKSFRDIQKGKNDRKANDLRWKIVHLCIPTAVRLAGRNTYFDSDICQRWRAYLETISHLFFYCEQSKKSGTLHPKL